MAERLIRAAAAWQDEAGAIIDPVLGKEWGQSSPRFVAGGAVLLQFGRIGDLRERVYRGMDWCCSRLALGQAQSPDFWIRELMTAWMALRNQEVDGAQRSRWEQLLRSIDPESIYSQVSRDGTNLHKLHNWTVYAAAGEGLRQVAGLAPPNDKDIVWGLKFFEKYVPAQLAHFSPDGLYRDPGDPFTYDMTTRLQFATPLEFGLETPLQPAIDALLRAGGLMQLFYVSPAGFAPFGGRTNQFHLQEAILAALAELEAKRYKTSEPELARAFKRQAHLSVASMRRWIEMEPHRHLKNGFAPTELHGCESYAQYSVYSLFAASCLGLAALFADESIEEGVTPAEAGGYLLEIAPAFHKIFAVCGRTQIEIDTNADQHYDATGLGRFHRKGVPPELGLSVPFPATPSFHIPADRQTARSVAIGPVWQLGDGEWTSLAELGEGLTSELTIIHEAEDSVEFSIDWQHQALHLAIQETYRLTEGRLHYGVAVQSQGRPVSALRLTVPLLHSDGDAKAEISLSVGRAEVRYRSAQYRVSYLPPQSLRCEQAIANRNGVYRLLELEYRGAQATLEMELEMADESMISYPTAESCD